jgi:ribosomal protein S18 acetylase RimI-like enzyme
VTTMSISVQVATLSDVSLLVRLNAVVQQLHVDQRPDLFSPVTPEAVATWFRQLLPQANCSVWLAVCDSVSVGYLLGLIHNRPATPFSPSRTWFEVDQLAVDSSYRNRGVGTALLSHAIAFARSSQIPNIEVTTWAFNTPAQSLFRNLGLVPKHLRFEMPPNQ